MLKGKKDEADPRIPEMKAAHEAKVAELKKQIKKCAICTADMGYVMHEGWYDRFVDEAEEEHEPKLQLLGRHAHCEVTSSNRDSIMSFERDSRALWAAIEELRPKNPSLTFLGRLRRRVTFGLSSVLRSVARHVEDIGVRK